MCLGIPGQVIKISGNKAKVKMDNHFHWLDISLIEEKVKVGDFLLSYQDAAINKISPQQAKEVLKLVANNHCHV